MAMALSGAFSSRQPQPSKMQRSAGRGDIRMPSVGAGLRTLGGIRRRGPDRLKYKEGRDGRRPWRGPVRRGGWSEHSHARPQEKRQIRPASLYARGGQKRRAKAAQGAPNSVRSWLNRLFPLHYFCRSGGTILARVLAEKRQKPKPCAAHLIIYVLPPSPWGPLWPPRRPPSWPSAGSRT